MKAAAILLALAGQANAAGFYSNDINGKTLLLDQGNESCGDKRVALAQDETGNVRFHGCWMQYVHSVVVFWNVGKATVVPTAAVTWDDRAPAKPVAPAEGSDS